MDMINLINLVVPAVAVWGIMHISLTAVGKWVLHIE